MMNYKYINRCITIYNIINYSKMEKYQNKKDMKLDNVQINRKELK